MLGLLRVKKVPTLLFTIHSLGNEFTRKNTPVHIFHLISFQLYFTTHVLLSFIVRIIYELQNKNK